MGLKSGGLQRKSKASQEIPSSSMADIAFLLLIFFMVTTVFQKDKKREILWPEAEAAEKMDDKQMEDVRNIVRPLYAQNTSLVISLRSDQNVRYQYIDLVQKELQAAGALRVVFATELEQDITRERR